MTRNVDPDLYPGWISPSYCGKLSYIAFFVGVRALCIEEKRKNGTWPLGPLRPVRSAEQSEVLRDWERLNFSKSTVPHVYLVAVRLLIRRSLKCGLISSTEEAKNLILTTICSDLDAVRDNFHFESVNSILNKSEEYATSRSFYKPLLAPGPLSSIDSIQCYNCFQPGHVDSHCNRGLNTNVIQPTSSEIWIGDVREYRGALRLDREECGQIIVYEYDTGYTRKYLFVIDFEDQRPNWQLVTRDAILACYEMICRGAEFAKITFPGVVVTRRPEELERLH